MFSTEAKSDTSIHLHFSATTRVNKCSVCRWQKVETLQVMNTATMPYVMSGAYRRAADPSARHLHSAVTQRQPGPFAKLLWPLVISLNNCDF